MPKKQAAQGNSKQAATEAAESTGEGAQDLTGLQKDQPREEAAASAAEARSAEALATGSASPLDGIEGVEGGQNPADRPEGATAPESPRTDREAAEAHQRAAEEATRIREDRAGRLLERLWRADGRGYRLFVEADDRALATRLVEAYTGEKEAAFVFTRPSVKPPFGEPILRGEVVKGEDGKDTVRYERG